MRFLTVSTDSDHPSVGRVVVGYTDAETRAGRRIRSAVFPEHEARVLAMRRIYLANLLEADAWRDA